MTTFVRAFLLFAILLVLALLLGQAGTVPVPVVLQVGTLAAATTAPVAITLAVAVLLVAFYLGRLTGWLVRLPQFFSKRHKKQEADHLADAYTAWVLNDLPSATRPLAQLKPETPAHADLATLLALQTAALTSQQAEAHLTNPRLAPVAALYLARLAAAQANWTEVKRLTAIGRQYAPTHLPMLVLQFKALVNLNDPAASDLIPALKPHLGATNTKLLTQVLQGPNALTARPTLDAPWVKSFQVWLSSPSETLPA